MIDLLISVSALNSFFVTTMRTPSIYSQDDPLTEALKPPESETEIERRLRLELEAEAKRVSEQIDEDLRLEREDMRRKRGDVKVSGSIYLYYALKILNVLYSFCY